MDTSILTRSSDESSTLRVHFKKALKLVTGAVDVGQGSKVEDRMTTINDRSKALAIKDASLHVANTSVPILRCGSGRIKDDHIGGAERN